MKKDISKELNIIKNAILNAVPALKIYFFGSYAYGNPNIDSDIDIYVVIPDDYNECLTNMFRKTMDNINISDFPIIDLFFVNESRYLKRKELFTFEETIVNKGELIYEN